MSKHDPAMSEPLYRFDMWVDTKGVFHIGFLNKAEDKEKYVYEGKLPRETAIRILADFIGFCVRPPNERMTAPVFAMSQADVEAWETTGELPMGEWTSSYEKND